MDFEKDIALIKDVLTNGLSQIKPKPKIGIEVNTFGLDVWIISKGFAKMMLHERYNLVFSLFNQKLDWEIEIPCPSTRNRLSSRIISNAINALLFQNVKLRVYGIFLFLAR
ncbi:hypothetical protein HYR99_13835 [Candidatus Poribacteria bacterium]|nr:hypothetical protein [Candidatus Poribacteria bacterium]